jgi:pimeloyl-ACP methyl ester carboxylesterase
MAALAALAAAGVFGLVLLVLRARAYAAEAERRWPAIGRFVEVEGVRLHLIERGAEAAPTLFFLHGANANAREFLPLAERLEPEHRALLLDRPGYGHSGRPRGAEHIETQARYAARALELAGAGPAILVCHSLGCGVGLRLALERPALVRGMVLIAPASHPYPGPNAWWTRLAANPLVGPLFAGLVVPSLAPLAAGAAIANTFRPAPAPKDYFAEAGVGLAFRPSAFRASAREVVATKKEYQQQAPRYGEIEAPAIILTSDKDRVVSPRRHARALAEGLQAAELVMLPNAGHMPHRTRPDAVILAIRRVAQIEAARAALM